MKHTFATLLALLPRAEGFSAGFGSHPSASVRRRVNFHRTCCSADERAQGSTAYCCAVLGRSLRFRAAPPCDRQQGRALITAVSLTLVRLVCWLTEADILALPQPKGPALGPARRGSELSRLSRSSIRSRRAPARLLDRFFWPSQTSSRARHSLDMRHSDARGAVLAGMADLAPFDRRRAVLPVRQLAEPADATIAAPLDRRGDGRPV